MAMMKADLRNAGILGTGLRGMGAFLYSTSSGNTANPVVGDKWLISTRGEALESPVSVFGGKVGSPFATASEGVTDAFGNFQLSGSFDQSQIGDWQEDWRVGGRHVGTWNFSVLPASEAKKVPPAMLLKPMPTIIPVKPDHVLSSQMGVGCRIGSWVNANPVMGIVVAVGVGLLVKRMK